MRTDPGPRMPAWLMLLGAIALVVLIVWAAGGWADRTADRGFATGVPITVEGCLTAGTDANAFALTPLELDPLGSTLADSATDVRPTFTYELVGDPSALRDHVGEVVNVNGVVAEDVERDAEVERKETTAPAVPERGDSPPPDEATVRTTEEAEIEVRRMQVESVEPTGQSCGEGSGGQSGAGVPQEPE